MLLDTSAWIELFIKSGKGERVRERLKRESCYTSIISMAETANWAEKQNLDGKELVKLITELSQILHLTSDIAFLAGELNFKRKKTEKKWGMMDSLILATAQVYGLKILTKDPQFMDLPDAEIL
ncbi:MAG: PIN domain-containing protein [Candidatus Aenigmarchaeota archaeon]|nr:PIN domain-containing protein [Candidatus Aenigmarchaeota archaeon]